MSSAAVSTVRRFMDAHAINVAAPTLRVLATDVIFLYLKTQWDWFDVLVTRSGMLVLSSSTTVGSITQLTNLDKRIVHRNYCRV